MDRSEESKFCLLSSSSSVLNSSLWVKWKVIFSKWSPATTLPLLFMLRIDTKINWLELFAAWTKSNIWFSPFPIAEISFLLFSVLCYSQNEGVVLKKLSEQMAWLWLTVLCLKKGYPYFWEKKKTKHKPIWLLPNAYLSNFLWKSKVHVQRNKENEDLTRCIRTVLYSTRTKECHEWWAL